MTWNSIILYIYIIHKLHVTCVTELARIDFHYLQLDKQKLIIVTKCVDFQIKHVANY